MKFAALSRRELLAIPGLFAIAAAVETRVFASDRVVYIGTYTGQTSKGIYAFRFDDGSGALGQRERPTDVASVPVHADPVAKLRITAIRPSVCAPSPSPASRRGR